MSPFKRRLSRLTRHTVALCLAALMMFTPLSPLQMVPRLAPVQSAQAGAIDDLGACIGGLANGALDLAKAQAKAAELFTVMTDPNYLACMGKAAGGDVVTIAFMVAMTALWASGTVDFTSPESCQQALKDVILKELAGALDSALYDTSADGSKHLTFPGEVLKALVGGKGIDLIEQVAHDAAQDLIDQLWNALSPITSYMDCGCSAAGTIAKAAELSKEIAGLIVDAGGETKKCLDLFQNIGSLPGELFNAAKDVLSDVANAVCDSAQAAVGIDACGPFKDAWEEGEKILGTVAGWAEDGIHAVSCFVFGCDPPPPPPQPPTCSTDPKNPNDASIACVCPAGMGFTVVTEAIKGKDYNHLINGVPADKTYYRDYKYCSSCADKAGIIGANGMCQTCPPGILPGPDGKCSKPVVCSADEALDQSGHACFSCPAGMHFSADRKKCDADPPVCAPGSGKVVIDTWMNGSQLAALKATIGPGYNSYAGKSSTCACPAGLFDNGSGTCTPVMQCPGWAKPNYTTGKCEATCGPKGFWGVVGGQELDSCHPCPAGQVSYNNICVPQCKPGEIRVGLDNGSKAGDFICTACSDGTAAGGATNAQGERTTCANACAPGTAWQTFTSPIMTGLNAASAKMVEGAACLACPAGTYAKTETVKGAFGSFSNFEVTTCQACGKFTTSEAGATACHALDASGAIALTPKGPMSKMKPVGLPRAEQKSLDKVVLPRPDGGRSETDGRRPQAERPSPTSCPPGRVWNGNRCVIALDDGDIDLSPRGAGSSVVRRAPSVAPSAPSAPTPSSAPPTVTYTPPGGYAAPSMRNNRP